MAKTAAHAEPRKRPSQARSAATVAAMVEAAARIIEVRGWTALTTNHVAELSGFSIGSLYQYFPSKEALPAELVRRERAMLLHDVGLAMALEAQLPFAIEQAVTAGLVQLRRRPRALHRLGRHACWVRVLLRSWQVIQAVASLKNRYDAALRGTIRMMAMKTRLMAGLGAHALGCLMFIVLSWLGFFLYTQLFGSLGSRGVAGGLALLLVFYVYAGTNLLLALLPSDRWKPWLCGVLGAAVLIYLLPQHPLRAIYFSVLSGGLSWLAVLASARLVERLRG